MHLIAQALVLCLIACVISSGCRDKSEAATQAHSSNRSWNVEGDVFGDEAHMLLVKNATTVTAQRIYPTVQAKENPYLLKNYEFGPTILLNVQDADNTKSLFTKRSSYDWKSTGLCEPTYGVVFTFASGEGVMRLAICYSCNMVGVFVGEDSEADSINMEWDCDPARVPLVNLAKSLFPEEAQILELQ